MGKTFFTSFMWNDCIFYCSIIPIHFNLNAIFLALSVDIWRNVRYILQVIPKYDDWMMMYERCLNNNCHIYPVCCLMPYNPWAWPPQVFGWRCSNMWFLIFFFAFSHHKFAIEGLVKSLVWGHYRFQPKNPAAGYKGHNPEI